MLPFGFTVECGSPLTKAVGARLLDEEWTSLDKQMTYTGDFITWLTVQGTAHRSLPELIDGFCRFLNAQGFAIKRCNLASETVNPLMTSTRHVWFDSIVDPGAINPAVVVARRQYEIGNALIDEVFFNAGSEESPQYVASPFYQVAKRGELHASIRPQGEKQPYPVFHDLAAIGCTTYFGLKLNSFAGMLQKIGLASACPGGLSTSQIDELRWSLSLLTLHVNTLIELAIKDTLARVYVGQDPGRRVTEGMIELGSVVSLDAAIWFSDLRDFTSIAEDLSAEQLVESLNSYFDAVVGAVYENGGEVLKYIGDAILAIFAVERFATAEEACAAALRAADASASALVQLNSARTRRGLPIFKHGVGLHLGAAQYGNIGARERLDFTLIGREVNVASRIEGMCKELGQTILASAKFANSAPSPMRELGAYVLKGVPEPVLLYVPS